MPSTVVKTAVSLDRDLYEQTEKLARKLGKSRSAVVAEALRMYIGDKEGRDLLGRINAALARIDQTEDAALRGAHARRQRKLIRDEW